jgi:hypothetical protein
MNFWLPGFPKAISEPLRLLRTDYTNSDTGLVVSLGCSELKARPRGKDSPRISAEKRWKRDPLEPG